MISVFSSDSADGAWQQAAQLFRTGSGFRAHDSRSGFTYELLHASFCISNPRQRWVTSRFPALNPAFALAEVVWIIKGREDEAFLTYWNSQLRKFAGDGPKFHGAYGHRLRKNFGFDQMDRAFHILTQCPNTRQLVLQIWDPNRDLPDEKGSSRADDIPCNVTSLIKLREGRLEWLQVLRSNDFFLGIPHNFVQFTCLQEILAGWLRVDVGSYNQISDSLHVYSRDVEGVFGSPAFVPEPNTDDLALSKDVSDGCFDELEHRIEIFIAESLSPTEHERAARWPSAPEGFRNILLLLAAEAARRRGWPELAREIMGSNSNRAFVQLWNRWSLRVGLDAA